MCWSDVCVGVLCVLECCMLYEHSPHGSLCYNLLGYQVQNHELLHCTDPTHQHLVKMYILVNPPGDWSAREQVTGVGHRERVTGSRLQG